ncbi:hypothetical protein [Kitasatospora purpeofusca]|uniref:hypothetical protein n=1 Tax=Kitasatospora purpeofusca TaxID=67352 RepID=UPI00386FF5DA|nr:hypothetical protein OIP63_25555 [Kitasatospora purpeofusca]
MSTVKTWLGEDWEAWCMLLIRRRYGAEQVQVVPAKHKGDLGIEAFTYDGCAFQCYAAQEPIPVAERYEKQRDKLTRDLAKLERKQLEFLKLLGEVKIKRYMLMVPFFDSHELVQHASSKAVEYRKKNLPHLDSDFQVVIVDEDAYSDERAELIGRQNRLVDVPERTSSDVQAWKEANERAVESADRKLRSIISEDPRRLSVLESLIMQYIKSENALDGLRQRYPDNWEIATRYRNHKEQLLVLQYPVGSMNVTVLAEIAKEIQEELKAEIPAMDSVLCATVAWASIADWIMRCPLSFA